MSENISYRDNTLTTVVATAVTILVVLEAIVFFLAALLHLGVQLPLGFTEPRIIPATVVEGLIGLFFAVSAFAILTRKTWAWPATIVAHGFAIAGILLGMAALAGGAGPNTEANEIYHRVTLVAAVVGLILLLTPVGKAALGRGSQNS